MDGSAVRRGRPSAHVSFARWHRERGLSGSPERFGESAAVLLADLCLVWAEQMLRDSGIDPMALSRAWPKYDAMRTELAVGQFADLVNDAGGFPTWDQVLAVSRRKSGNYTVRRPLEIGATLAGCSQHVLTLLGGYGEAIGEAFQLRDDLLGIFGSPSVTGKPAGNDLRERKATSVVVAAHHLADPSLRRQLAELMSAKDLSDNDIRRWKTLIAATGAVDWIERSIDLRIRQASRWVDTGHLRRRWYGRRSQTWPPHAPTGPHDGRLVVAHRRGKHRASGRGRRRTGRLVGGAAPRRTRPQGHRGGARSASGRTGRSPRHRRLSPRHRSDRADDARHHRRRVRRRRRINL